MINQIVYAPLYFCLGLFFGISMESYAGSSHFPTIIGKNSTLKQVASNASQGHGGV